MDRGVLLGSVGGSGLLVLLHVVILLEVAILIIVLIILGRRVLLGGLGEVNDLAAGAGGNNVVKVDGRLGISLILVIVDCAL